MSRVQESGPVRVERRRGPWEAPVSAARAVAAGRGSRTGSARSRDVV